MRPSGSDSPLAALSAPPTSDDKDAWNRLFGCPKRGQRPGEAGERAVGAAQRSRHALRHRRRFEATGQRRRQFVAALRLGDRGSGRRSIAPTPCCAKTIPGVCEYHRHRGVRNARRPGCDDARRGLARLPRLRERGPARRARRPRLVSPRNRAPARGAFTRKPRRTLAQRGFVWTSTTLPSACPGRDLLSSRWVRPGRRFGG